MAATASRGNLSGLRRKDSLVHHLRVAFAASRGATERLSRQVLLAAGP
jgi:hypothetical protein